MAEPAPYVQAESGRQIEQISPPVPVFGLLTVLPVAAVAVAVACY